MTVQYIQNPQIFQKPDDDNRNSIDSVAAHESLEIENVEYLEENAHVEDYIEDTDEKEDNFYPNAIHCLLDLYKSRYNKDLMAESATINVAQLWRDIAKEMQESFFEFNEHQIQLKYTSLREQYFSLQTKEDIDSFDYFEQLHDIYKDKNIEKIANGYNGTKIISAYYKDEIFLQPEQLEMNEAQIRDFKSEEIVHKEHEFIDMVEKELQAMESEKVSKNDKQKKANIECSSSKKLKSITNTFEQQSRAKRARLEAEFCGERRKSYEASDTDGSSSFSLQLYNQEQERRHREKMSLLEKSLALQERALEQQQQLLRELIKRIPS